MFDFWVDSERFYTELLRDFLNRRLNFPRITFVIFWVFLGSSIHLYLTRSLIGFLYFLGTGAGLALLLTLLYVLGLYLINAEVNFVSLLLGIFFLYFVTYSISLLGLLFIQFSGYHTGLIVFIWYLIVGAFTLHHLFKQILITGRHDPKTIRLLTFFPFGIFVLTAYAPLFNSRTTLFKIIPGISFTWINYSLEIIFLLIVAICTICVIRLFETQLSVTALAHFVLAIGLVGLFSLIAGVPYVTWDQVNQSLEEPLEPLDLPIAKDQALDNYRKRHKFLKKHSDNPHLEGLEAGDTVPSELKPTLNEYLNLVKDRSFVAPNSRFKSPADTSLETIPNISICRAIKIYSVNLAQYGDMNKGLENLQIMMNSTTSLMKANPILIDYLVQFACHGITIDGFRSIVLKTDLSSKEKKKLLDVLKRFREFSLRNTLANSFRNELRFSENYLRHTQRKNSITKLASLPLFSLDETLRVYRVFYKNSCWRRADTRCSHVFKDQFKSPPSLLEILFNNPSNPVGELLAPISLSQILDQNYSRDINSNQTKLNCLILTLGGKDSLKNKYTKNLLTGAPLDDSCIGDWNFEPDKVP